MTREGTGAHWARHEFGFWILATAIALAAIASDVTPFVRGPAPYAPEWRWRRRPASTSRRAAPAALAGAGLLGLLILSELPTARRHPRRAAGVLLAAAVVAGWAFELSLLDLEPDGALATLLDRSVSRTYTSYYTVAISREARNPLAFLRRHATLLEGYRKAAKHAATHPPGPVLYFRALVALCQAFPRMAASLLKAAAAPGGDPRMAGALLGGLLFGLAGSATAWPVAALARAVVGDPLAAARAGILFCLVPGPVLMAPELDQALGLPVTAALACLAGAVTAGGAWRAIAAGAMGALALFFSYGAAAFLGLGGLAVAALALGREGGAVRAAKAFALATAAGGAAISAAAMLGHEPLASARTALAIHRASYTEPRDYLIWLTFNPLDLALFLGAPLAAAGALRAVASAAALLRGSAGDRSSSHRPAAQRAADTFRVAVAAGLAALVLSGATRGEVGRIWIPLMPLLLVATLARPSSDADAAGPTLGESLVLGVLLASLCFAIRIWWAVP